MKTEVHISDIRAFRMCRRQWHFGSLMPGRLGLERERPYMPFFTGRVMHWALQRWYEDGADVVEAAREVMEAEIYVMEQETELWPEEHTALQEQCNLIFGMLQHYVQWASTAAPGTELWADDRLEFIAFETEFSVPFRTLKGRKSPKVFLAGRFDGVVRRKDDGTYWLWEVKTARSVDNLVRTLDLDIQAGGYILAAQELLNTQVSGVVYNIIRKKLPTQPRVLQNGTLSKANNIDTTAESYWAAVLRNHPDAGIDTLVEMYGDMIDMLYQKGNTFFARIPVRRSRRELEVLQDDLWRDALEMSSLNCRIYPNPSWATCNFCQFKGPCYALQTGADHEYIIEHEYRPRKRWDYFTTNPDSEGSI